MSESKKTSSPYVVLDNRSLDQWKVTELKEELKRRKLMTKGLKDDLIRRLDEAVRSEVEEANQNHDNGVNDITQPEVPSDDATVETPVAEKTTSIIDDSSANNESLEEEKITETFDKKVSLEKDRLAEKMDSDGSLEKDGLVEKLDNNESSEKHNITENLDDENRDSRDVPVENYGLQPSARKLVTEGEHGIEGFQVLQEVSAETSVLVSEGMVSEELGQQDLQNVEINHEGEVSNLQPEDGESKPESQSPKEEVKPNSYHIGGQVVEVSLVKSDSNSVDTMSITEKNELKDNVIADDVKLELDVKPEMVQPSSSKVVLDDAKTESVVVDEPHEDKLTTEEKDVNNAESINICKKNDTEDVGSPEKLNLDRSSGDDSMDEDALESKQIDSKFNSQDMGDISKKTELPLEEDEPVDVMVEDTPAAKNTESTKDNSDPSVVPIKRKLHDQEAVTNSEVVKRQRRWNSESLKVPEQHSTNPSLSTTPKDAFQASMKHSFSRSDSSVSHEEPKERVVPPSSKPPTTSLRIDRFLRPFTLKAVQELLGKTGTVVSFWMDHIKTHCYVTYSSVEEAVETRNAVYNLQWPVNGGRLLLAEFVDASEVKSRTEASLPSPRTPVTPTVPQPPPAAAQPPQQLPPPPLPLPPPPPFSLPPQSREPNLPPPPPLHEPPIVTLDDLFRKTRATPRIYYLPLSNEQVAAKVKGQGKTAKQSAGVAFRKEQRWLSRSSFRDRFRCFPRTLHLFKNPNTRKLRSWIGTNICSIYFPDIENLFLKTLYHV
ncbi:apoptotic chromatin condensation inducer in the nucleus-like isoform X2 [Cynara cardunculus var. scolymus]|uniref:apoptotic chromatin condensation inducer in the nucleus-like isoform X2 n=1 Tax=Cynara cardunculus var. scolymus TaxID=59895 RepID=UPI000D627A46|nr:apoptotic chromatin condensation inducer in the nucleus-like isoform X2 [Cynara cardunculus var. scolymus]